MGEGDSILRHDPVGKNHSGRYLPGRSRPFRRARAWISSRRNNYPSRTLSVVCTREHHSSDLGQELSLRHRPISPLKRTLMSKLFVCYWRTPINNYISQFLSCVLSFLEIDSLRLVYCIYNENPRLKVICVHSRLTILIGILLDDVYLYH